MGLLKPGGEMTQAWGPSRLALEPHAWLQIKRGRGYWLAYPGARFNSRVHMGVDFGGMGIGQELLAAEAGTVTASFYDKFNGGGNVVEIEIRPGVRYSYNHCDTRLVNRVGRHVRRGTPIATVGCSGTIWTGQVFIASCLAAHCHVNLTIREKLSDGITRTMLYDFADFLDGGSKEDDPRIRPLNRERK